MLRYRPKMLALTTISASFSSIKTKSTTLRSNIAKLFDTAEMWQLQKPGNVSYAQAGPRWRNRGIPHGARTQPEEPNAHALLGIVLGRKGNLEGP